MKYSTPIKYARPWSFMHVKAGILKINGCTKPTPHIALQTNFEIICTLKCMIHWLPYYWANQMATTTAIRKVKKYTLPVPFANDKYYGNNWMCTAQEIE